jgi:hypothetical protein
VAREHADLVAGLEGVAAQDVEVAQRPLHGHAPPSVETCSHRHPLAKLKSVTRMMRATETHTIELVNGLV